MRKARPTGSHRRRRMTRREKAGVIASWAAIAIGLLLLVSPASADPPVPTADPEGEPTAVVDPTLSAAERDEALAILSSNTFANQVLAGRTYTVTEAGPWTTFTNQRLGASLLLTLKEPAAYGLTNWPAMKYDETEGTSPPYETVTFPASAVAVTEFKVNIDLTQDLLVGMVPAGDAIVSPGGG